ncbi:MAG: DUF4842 domain-containing protein [Prevotella sp.]
MKIKKTALSGSLVAIAAAAAIMSSCSREVELINPNQVVQDYSNGWDNKFGNIDENQDWNLATTATVNINLTAIGATSVEVYSSLPGSANSTKMAEFSLGTANMAFDIAKGTSTVYVVAKDAKGNVVLADYYAVEDGNVSVSAGNKAKTRAITTRSVSLATNISAFGNFRDENHLWPSKLWDNQWNPAIDFNKVFSLYRLNGVQTRDASSCKISDIIDIVGQNGVFGERGKDSEGKCNRKHWEEQLKPSQGVEYVMESAGPMEISFMYGGTDKKNKFGYLYYRNGATQDEILRAPRYILMEDATPQGNVKVDGVAMGDGDGMKLPNLVNQYEKYNGKDCLLTGTTYKLTYFGEDGTGTPSDNFPAGTHIVFFEIIDGGNMQSETQYGSKIRYSLPWMNNMFYYKSNEQHPSYEVEDSAKDFVTYKWGGQIVLGMEDEGGDDDMNDILFFVKGNVKDDDITDIGEDPEAPSWIIACEDLGDTNDYDFNDVVFKVSHVAGETTAYVTPLAAGGVLETYIIYGTKELGETHQLLGSDKKADGSYPIINTYSITAQGQKIPVTVPSDFSMANNMGGFAIHVVRTHTNAYTIYAPTSGLAPQMFCVPGTWAWPKERVNIEVAYPQFANWSANSNNIEWYNSPVEGSTIK